MLARQLVVRVVVTVATVVLTTLRWMQGCWMEMLSQSVPPAGRVCVQGLGAWAWAGAVGLGLGLGV